MSDRVLSVMRYMVSPPTPCDLPGELHVTALLSKDATAFQEAVAARYVAIGAKPKPPSWVWAHYAETYVEYCAQLGQDAPSFVSIATITAAGWDMLKLTRDALPAPCWHRSG